MDAKQAIEEPESQKSATEAETASLKRRSGPQQRQNPPPFSAHPLLDTTSPLQSMKGNGLIKRKLTYELGLGWQGLGAPPAVPSFQNADVGAIVQKK